MDPISDLIIRIKNASNARHETVTMPYSKIKAAICDLLAKEGYIKGATKKGKKINKYLEVELLYKDAKPRISDVKRISHLGKRVYKKVSDIKPVRNNFGALVLSTPSGILTGKEAVKEKVGGEALFEIW
ncbi:MAG: 30S ribosomal protein S8 [Candidatus Paceibacterota bacterium]